METKKWWTSKTIWVGVVSILTAALLLAAQSPSLEAYAEWFLLVQGILTIILRVITTTSIEGGPK